MRRWLVAQLTGTGTDEDPIRPNLGSFAERVDGWAMAGSDGTECLVLVVEIPTRQPRRRRPGDPREVGEEEFDDSARRERIDDLLRNNLSTEIHRLRGGAGWQPEQVDVNLGAG